MPYQLTRDPSGRPRVALSGEPPCCWALQAAPPSIEPELGRGDWLVVAFPAWSMPDIEAVGVALDVARRFGCAFQLGLRPFDSPDEHRSWLPELTGGQTPIWLAFRDGKLRMERHGRLDADTLAEAVTAAFAPA
jgi:hypothetical protein